MKTLLLSSLIVLFALALPSFSQDPGKLPFDHHDLPEGPDPFTAPNEIPRMVQVPGACKEPEPPLTDDASLRRLGLTHGQEYSRYFDEAQAYLVCLERTKFDYMDVVRQHGRSYSNTLIR